MRGWHKESYRHYLAGKGIKTSYYNSKSKSSPLNYYMPATKLVSVDKPFEIYENDSPYGGKIEHRVLKKWQTDDNKPYARWFVGGKSSETGDWDFGDMYVERIKSGRKLSDEEVAERIKLDPGPEAMRK